MLKVGDRVIDKYALYIEDREIGVVISNKGGNPRFPYLVDFITQPNTIAYALDELEKESVKLRIVEQANSSCQDEYTLLGIHGEVLVEDIDPWSLPTVYELLEALEIDYE